MIETGSYLIMFPIMLLFSFCTLHSRHCHSFVWTFYELLYQTLGGKNDWNVSYLINQLNLLARNWVLMFT